MYEYRAKLSRVVDGDTVDLEIDLGFHVSVKERFRLRGIDTPEVRTRDLEEKARGLLAKGYLEDLLNNSSEIRVKTKKDAKGKFGRWIAVLYADGVNVNDLLIREGHAVPYL